jgi:competence protein ComEC
MMLMLLVLLGLGWGAPGASVRDLPVGIPRLPLTGFVRSTSGRRIARDLEVARDGRWVHVCGEFLLRGVDDLGDGAFVGRGFLVPVDEPRLQGLANPSLRQRLGGQRGWIDLEEGWPVGPRCGLWRSDTQERLRGRIGRSLPAPIQTLIPMLVWGEAGEADPEILRVFRATGTMHLVAISGLHVSLIALLVEFALRLLVRNPIPRLLLSLAGLAGYTALVGPMPPVVRSAIMAACILVGRAVGRPGSMGAAWWTSLLAVLVATPGEAASPGMQLSFGATAALLLRPSMPRRWDPLASSYAATAATTGVLWAHFGETAPLSIVANLIGIPAFTPVLIAILWGLAWGNPANPTLQALAWGPTRVFAYCWIRPLGLMTPIGEATIVRFSPGPVVGLLATLGFLGILALARRARGTRRALAWMILVGIPFLLVAGSVPPLFAARRTFDAEAQVLPVGQGDATLIRFSGGADYLFDTGPGGPDGARGRRALAPALRFLGVRRLRGVLLSHGDEDHTGGLRGLLLAGIPVDTLYVSATAGVRRALPRKGFPPVRAVMAGWSRTEGDGRIEALWPPTGSNPRTGNEGSLVLRLSAPGGAMLLPGDLGHAAEDSLAHAPGLLPADVLLAGHHGSSGSSGAAWCARIRPRLAMISCGARNRHGHPHAAALRRLEGAGAAIHRTDREGTLALRWAAGDLLFRGGGCGAWKPVL